MRSHRPKFLALGFLSLIGSAQADVMSSSRPASMPALAPPPEVSRSEPEARNPLDLNTAMAGLKSESFPLLRHAKATGLADSTLGRPETTTTAPVPLPRPALTPDTRLGASTPRILQSGDISDSDLESQENPRRNIRIPEPASLTLLAAGLIGLVARRRMRQNLQPKPKASDNPE